MVSVTNVRVEKEASTQTLVGLVNDKEARFRFPIDVNITARGEPFLSYAIFLGMARGEDLEFDDSAPLSPHLLGNLNKVQAVLKQWSPEFTKVRILASAVEVPKLNDGVISSFSGGIDSSYTLAEHFDEITHIVTLNNFDWLAGPQEFEPLLAKNAAVAQKIGKGFIPIETNVREVADAFKIKWTYLHGAFLSLIVATLGFERFYFPSSYTYLDLHPWGSHPLLDPLWSTDTTQVIHDGADKRRSQKTSLIATNPQLLGQLQVCWDNSSHNCGQCSKCARTQIVLNMLGVDESPIPKARSEELVPYLKVNSIPDIAFAWDIMTMAREHGQNRVANAVEQQLTIFGLKKSLRGLKRNTLRWVRTKTGRLQDAPSDDTIALRSPYNY